jgi:invasion protein IalB
MRPVGHGIAAFRLLVPATRDDAQTSFQGPEAARVALQGEVESNMAYGTLQSAAAGRIRHAGAVALALAVGAAGLAGTASAQQPAPPAAPPAAKKAPEKKAPAAAPAGKSGQAAPAPGSQSAWVKLCEKASGVMKGKDGKEEQKELNICLTHHERLDGNTGMVLVSAALRQVEGQDKQHFMVMVPLGMMLQAGMRATLYPKDAWEKVQKKEQIDESKLKAIKLTYTLCHPAGCTAEIEATPELINDLKSDGGLVVFSIGANGAPVGFPVPLNGFAESLVGTPVDNKQYGEARKALMEQIAARQQQLIEQQKAEAQKGAPAAAPAAKAPPAEKKK